MLEDSGCRISHYLLATGRKSGFRIQSLAVDRVFLSGQNSDNHGSFAVHILLAVNTSTVDLRTLTKLMLKLAGLYFLMSTVIGVIGYATNPAPDTWLWYSVVYVLYLAAGIWLFWFPGSIVNSVLRIKGDELEGAVTAQKLLGVGFALLGAYFVGSGAYSCIYVIARTKWYYRFTDTLSGARGPDFGAADFATVIASVAEILIGLGLWLGREKLARLGANGNVDR